jgi:hypothetical protein
VRWGSSAGKCIVFLFADYNSPDCFLEKLVPDIVLRVQRDKEFKTGRYGSCFSGKAITSYFVANKKTILLLAF